MEQFAVRGQRRIRLGNAAGAARPSRPTPGICSSSSRPPSAATWRLRFWSARKTDEAVIREQRERIATLRQRLGTLDVADARQLTGIADALVHRSVWIIGGDGWAYDIGFGGLDHVLAIGTQRQHPGARYGRLLEYRRTGLEVDAPRGGRQVRRGRQSRQAEGPGHAGRVVRQRLRGADRAWAPTRCRRCACSRRRESYPGTSLILAYSHCIAHGIEMSTSMTHQKDIVKSGFWPLYRYDPREAKQGGHPFHLDSRKPTMPFKELAKTEARFAMLARSQPAQAEVLFRLAQQDIDDTWRYYEQMAGIERSLAESAARAAPHGNGQGEEKA